MEEGTQEDAGEAEVDASAPPQESAEEAACEEQEQLDANAPMEASPDEASCEAEERLDLDAPIEASPDQASCEAEEQLDLDAPPIEASPDEASCEAAEQLDLDAPIEDGDGALPGAWGEVDMDVTATIEEVPEEMATTSKMDPDVSPLEEGQDAGESAAASLEGDFDAANKLRSLAQLSGSGTATTIVAEPPGGWVLAVTAPEEELTASTALQRLIEEPAEEDETNPARAAIEAELEAAAELEEVTEPAAEGAVAPIDWAKLDSAVEALVEASLLGHIPEFLASFSTRSVPEAEAPEAEQEEASEVAQEEAQLEAHSASDRESRLEASCLADEEAQFDALSVSDVPATPPPQEEKFELDVAAVLAEQKLFKECTPTHLERLASWADEIEVPPGTPLNLEKCTDLFVVKAGALRFRVGNGPIAVAGPGFVFNHIGFLKLHGEVQQFALNVHDAEPPGLDRLSLTRGSQTTSVLAHGSDDDDTAPPAIFKDRMGDVGMSDLPTSGVDEYRNLYNMCPYAARVGHRDREPDHVIMAKKLSIRRSKREGATTSDVGFVTMKVCGGSIGDVPSVGMQAASTINGAVLTSISQRLLLEVAADAKRSTGDSETRFSIITFEENCKRIVPLWQNLMTHLGRVVFPLAPPQATWELVELARPFSIEAGKVIIEEGELESSDDMILITEGMASVEELVRINPEGEQTIRFLGRLRRGALIGDYALSGSSLPRSATVKAKSRVSGLRLPSEQLLNAVRHFPGILSFFCEERLVQVAECIVERLPSRIEVVGSLHLFRGFDYVFINALSHAGEQRVHFCGQACVEQGSENGVLCVLEYGRCAVEIAGVGQVAEVPAGNCFGERTLLDETLKANATIRVFTPLALLLAITRKSLRNTLDIYPHLEDRVEELRRAPMEGRVKGSAIVHIELFRGCGTPFLDELNNHVDVRSYMPGQNIIVEGDKEEDPRMFVLVGGKVVSERAGAQMGVITTGACFGELAMMGYASTRVCSIRALTYCFLKSISKSDFRRALEKYPEEEKHFERKNYTDNRTKLRWPCINIPRVDYLMDLFSEKKKVAAGEVLEEQKDCVILVTAGTFEQLTSEGKAVRCLSAIAIYNETVLLGGSSGGDTLVALTDGAVETLSKDAWGKVTAEFPKQLDEISASILAYCAYSSEQRLLRNSNNRLELLRMTAAFFRIVSDDFLMALRGKLSGKVFDAGSWIVPERYVKGGADKATMYFILEGTARTVEGMCVEPGMIFGEGVVLGVQDSYSSTLFAKTQVVAFALTNSDFEAALQAYDHEAQLFDKLRREMRIVNSEILAARLRCTNAFCEVDGDFLNGLCSIVHLSYFAPGEIIFEEKSPCFFGECCFYLLLAGQVKAEGNLGQTFGIVRGGEIFGEAGAFGLTHERSATNHAWSHGIVCCARFEGSHIKAALNRFPHARQPLADLFTERLALNDYVEKHRRRWLAEVAVPALANAPLLAGCPKDFLFDVALSLTEHPYNVDDVITNIGEETKSMLILLRGQMELVSKCGTRICTLKEGCCFGEVAVLGLFSQQMATLRAKTPARVLSVTEDALKAALKGPNGRTLAMGFEHMVANRRQQVSQGEPMTLLPISSSADNLAIRAIALLADRVHLDAGDIWTPLPDSDPCGPHFGVLAKGTATIEMVHDRQKVMDLNAGALILEGLTSQFGAHIRAQTYCEGYRVRQNEFNMAIKASTTSDEWIWQYKLLAKQIRENLYSRLKGCRGLIDGLAPQPKDNDIQDYRATLMESMNRAKAHKKLREFGSDAKSKKLPLVSSHSDPSLKRSVTTPAGLTDSSRPSSVLSRSCTFAGSHLTNVTMKFSPKAERPLSKQSYTTHVQLPKLTPDATRRSLMRVQSAA